MKLIALNLNTPTKKGHIYTTELINKLIADNRDKINEKKILVEKSVNPDGVEVNLIDVVGCVTDMEVVDEKWVCWVEFINCPLEIIVALNDGMLSIRPRGIGHIDENRISDDYVLISFMITDDPA